MRQSAGTVKVRRYHMRSSCRSRPESWDSTGYGTRMRWARFLPTRGCWSPLAAAGEPRGQVPPPRRLFLRLGGGELPAAVEVLPRVAGQLGPRVLRMGVVRSHLV